MAGKEEKVSKSDTSAKADNTLVKKKVVKTKEQTNGSTKKGTDTKAKTTSEAKEVKAAKSGKRSAKAVKEVEEKLAKEERKSTQVEKEAETKPKAQPQPSRARIVRRAKGYRKAAEQIDKTKPYKLREALELAKKTSHVKFDATVELHVNLAVDPKQADQNIRDTVILPAGTGKTIRIAVFADPEGVSAAKKAGADIAGSEEFLEQLEKEEINFDVLISTPMMMAKLGKYARLLGPKGLMPNPKSGTVSKDVSKAVKDAKAGRVEYRVDSTGIIHISIGKVSFPSDKLLENAKAVFSSVKSNKPASLKGAYMSSAFVATSMGPSIQLDVSDINSL